MNTTSETLVGQISPSKSRKGEVKECLVAHDVADKCEIGWKNQTKQTACNHEQEAFPVKFMN